MFLQFTCPANVGSARLGEVMAGQVRLFGLTCTPKQPQKHSRGTSAVQVNSRKISGNEDFADIAGRARNDGTLNRVQGDGNDLVTGKGQIYHCRRHYSSDQ